MPKIKDLKKKPTLRTQLKEAKANAEGFKTKSEYYKKQYDTLGKIAVIAFLILTPLLIWGGWDMHDDMRSESIMKTGYDNAMTKVYHDIKKECTSTLEQKFFHYEPKINRTCLLPQCEEWCEEDLKNYNSWDMYEEVQAEESCINRCMSTFINRVQEEPDVAERTGCVEWIEIDDTEITCLSYNYTILEDNPLIKWAKYNQLEGVN